MLWQILGITTIILLIVFFAFTLRILFVFILGFKKNWVLNKSVSKNVFSGKLSLSIILLFFMVSFGLVGGMQLMNTSGSRTIMKQFDENSVFQAENGDYIISVFDPIKKAAAEYYTYDTGKELSSYEYVNDMLIQYTLSTETIKYFNNTNAYNDIELINSEVVAPDIVFSDDIFSSLSPYTIGWTLDEWEEALEYQLAETTEDWEINTILGGGTSFIDLMVQTFFSDDYKIIGKFLLMYNIFTDPIPDNKVFLPGYDKHINIINSFINELSFKITSYVNATPLNSKGKTDFEFVIINDLDLSKSDGGGSISTNDQDKFIKISNDGRETNKLTFIDGVSTTEQFRMLSSMSTNSEKGLNQTYEVLVQEDFLVANGYSVGQTIQFGTSNTCFKIAGSVRFNEITYPSMGMNILPDKKEQAFIGINLSDFLLFAQKNEYSSITSPQMKIFFGLDSTYDRIDSISDWTNIYGPIWTDFVGNINQFSSSVTYLNNSYDSSREDIISQSKFWAWDSNGEVNVSWIMGSLDDNDVFYQNGIFVGWGTEWNSFRVMNQWASQESIRAILGPSEIGNLSIMLKIMIGIFLIIVLIVLGMLVNKRIKSSSKQLGTLKAMGMKNKDISSSYILFPMIIIVMGFLLASLISPIVMWALTGLMSQYYYITFSAFALSWGYFISILFIPLIMSISLAYTMSMWTLRRSTLDLLTNKTNDQPNIMVRAIGYATPRKTPFALTYITKGMFRAVGKSSLLFISIFLATLLSAFAMSSTTMIQKQTAEIMEYMNYETMQMGVIENKGQYKMEALYFIDEGGELVQRTEDPSDGYYFSYESVIVENTELNEHSLEPIGITQEDTKEIIKTLKFPNDPNAFEVLYNEVHKLVFSPFNNSGSELNNSDIFDTYYFTDEYMEILFISELSLEFLYNKTHDDNTTFKGWEEAQTTGIQFSSIKPLIEPWAFQVAVNINKSGSLESANNLPDKIKAIQKSTSDLVLGTYYYDQFYEVPNDYIAIGNSHKAINSTDHESYEEKDFYGTTSNILILNDKEAFTNGLGTKENQIGKELWDDNLSQYFTDDGKVKEGLSYIPVIATTQSVVKINQWVDDGYATIDDRGVYTLSITIPVIESNTLTTETKYRKDETILVDIKVEDEVFLGLDFGGITVKPLFEAYLENYDYSGDLLVYNKELGGFIFERNGEKFVIYGDTYEEAFQSNYDEISTVKNNNNGDGDMPKPETIEYIPAPSSFVLTGDGESQMWQEDNGVITFNDLFNLSDEINNPQLGSGIEYTNGFPISMDILLEQGEAAYELIISMFYIISLFAIFISTTIIIIAMKDIIDSSKREVSMLKAFGYSNTRSTFLIMTPYLFVMILAVVISIPITFAGLGLLAGIFTSITGNVFVFTLSVLQWFILLGYVTSISLALLLLGYISFSRTNALEAIKETDE